MANLKEIESQIAAQEKRHAELDEKLVKHGVFDASVIGAMTLVDKQLKDLRPRRAALLAGQADPADALSKAVAPVATTLRPPRWITTKETRATAAETHKKNVEVALTLPLDTPMDDLRDLYATEAQFALVESTLRKYADEILENGRACEFNERTYVALVAMLWRASATTAATFHWAGNQRRLFEQRVEAIESTERHFSSSEMQRLTAYLALQFDTAPMLKRIEDLERRPKMEYLGIWNAEKFYEIGDVVTDHGSMFFCRQSTRERPGENNSCWQLCVKRGQDGRDGRK